MQVGNFDAILISGGDGTFRIVMEEILKFSPDIPKIGQLTSGTGNDFYFNFHQKTSQIEYLQKLLKPKLLKIDAGQVKYRNITGEIITRNFFSSFGALAYSQALYEANKYSKLGSLKYTIGGIITSIKGRKTPIKLFMEGDIVYQGEAKVLSCMKTQFAGGHLRLSPFARADDGLLDLFFCKNHNLLDMITALRSGQHVYTDKISYMKARNFRVEFKE